MSRKVASKALLPQRDTISTMMLSPESRPALYISAIDQCMPQVSKQGKKARFLLCYVATGAP
jgi:hypothetical protein